MRRRLPAPRRRRLLATRWQRRLPGIPATGSGRSLAPARARLAARSCDRAARRASRARPGRRPTPSVATGHAATATARRAVPRSRSPTARADAREDAPDDARCTDNRRRTTTPNRERRSRPAGEERLHDRPRLAADEQGSARPPAAARARRGERALPGRRPQLVRSSRACTRATTSSSPGSTTRSRQAQRRPRRARAVHERLPDARHPLRRCKCCERGAGRDVRCKGNDSGDFVTAPAGRVGSRFWRRDCGLLTCGLTKLCGNFIGAEIL